MSRKGFFFMVCESAFLLAPAFSLQLERDFRMHTVAVIRPSNTQLERKQSWHSIKTIAIYWFH